MRAVKRNDTVVVRLNSPWEKFMYCVAYNSAFCWRIVEEPESGEFAYLRLEWLLRNHLCTFARRCEVGEISFPLSRQAAAPNTRSSTWKQNNNNLLCIRVPRVNSLASQQIPPDYTDADYTVWPMQSSLFHFNGERRDDERWTGWSTTKSKFGSLGYAFHFWSFILFPQIERTGLKWTSWGSFREVNVLWAEEAGR